DSVNDNSKAQSPWVAQPKNPHYVAPSSGSPADNANVKAYVRSSLADVPSYFTAFSVPDPDSVNEALTGPLYRVAGTLVPSLQITRKFDRTQVSTASLAGSDASANSVAEMVDIMTTIHMKHWTGDAADEFTRYCLRFKEMAQLQNQFAISLAEIMDAHLEIRRRQLSDIWNIGEKTIKTLDSLDEWCNGKKSSQNAITVVGAVAAVVVVATQPEVDAVAVGAEVIQSFAAIMGTFPDQDHTEPADISGATVQAVIESMIAA